MILFTYTKLKNVIVMIINVFKNTKIKIFIDLKLF